MIQIRVERNAAGQMLGFSVTGHAAYKKKNDIVCAGISAIAQTAWIGLEHHLSVSCDIVIDRGDMQLKLPELSAEEFAIAQVILSTLLLGFQSLQEGYPNNIQIIDAI